MLSGKTNYYLKKKKTKQTLHFYIKTFRTFVYESFLYF